MKVYTKFLINIFFRSFVFVLLIITSLVFFLNLLTELEFFKDMELSLSYPFFLSLLNSPSLIFEMFPFIFLITTQLFFIKLFDNNEIQIFKYSGLENSKILLRLSLISLLSGLFVILLFYNLSSNLKNIYLEIKSNYTNDGKYLAMITKNGLWIKDINENKILIINSSSIESNFLLNNFITEFDENFNVIRNIQSEKIDIKDKKWVIFNSKIYKKNNYDFVEKLNFNSSFNLENIQKLFSNLSSLNLYELYKLRKNYKQLNYSITDIDIQLLKIITYPLYLLLITLFSALIMLNIKEIKGTIFKISIGLFFSVIIYYLNNFSYVLGSTERVSIYFSVFVPMIVLGLINILMLKKVNAK